ncbi:MAG: cytochrome c biogenesis protein CcsA [Candidatus Coatesbacteria bacterium]|nr:MAG: cytochrome c biogenesis protein CcsA [Candidatus Coatesbacteria bacterium]
MVNRVVVLALIGAIFAATPPAVAEYEPDFDSIEEAGLPGVFAEMPVYTGRPTPWAVYAANAYDTMKGSGKVSESDLSRDKQATVLALVLDEEYRRKGRVLYVEAGEAPGVTSSGWYSLTEFERSVIPVVMNAAMGADDVEKANRQAHELVGRAGRVNALNFTLLALAPPAEEGEPWTPVLREGSEFAPAAEKVLAAYAGGDSGDLRVTALGLKTALDSAPGAPGKGKIKLEHLTARLNPVTWTFVAYIVGALLMFFWAGLRWRWMTAAVVGLAVIGFAFQTYAIIARMIISGNWPTSGMYEYLLVFSWASALFYLAFFVKTRQVFLGIVVLPVAFILLVLGSIFPSEIEGQLVPALQSYWLTIHVTLACLGEGAFALAFAAGLLYLIKPQGKLNFLPDKEKLDRVGYAAVAVGYPLFTVGALVAGAIWAQKAWSVWWSWDPKEVASLVVFLIATVYLHARHLRGWRGAKTAILQIVIFVTAILTLFSNMIFGGLHSYT